MATGSTCTDGASGTSSAGSRSGSRADDAHTTGRLLDTTATVVAAIRAVAADLTVDGEVRRVLVQTVLSSLAPEELR